MRTYCQGARRRIFLTLFLLLSALAPERTSAVSVHHIESPSSITSSESAAFAPQFVKRDAPVFTGEYIASDPAIIQEDGHLRLFYTCFIVPATGFVPEDVRAGICSATSNDGLSWTEVDSGNSTTAGLVLSGRDGSWEENLEASFAIRVEDTYLLYYSGYESEGNPTLGFPARLSVASSTDGIHFERISNDPILESTAGWYDNDAIYSPAIAISGEQLVMVYAGHCYTDCDFGYNVTLLGASSTDGFTWTKLEQPVLQGAPLGLDWTRDGVAEPALLFGPDRRWHLFFTALAGDLREIGLASGPTPFGPWTVLDEPVLRPTARAFDEGGVLAPFVLMYGGVVRMWYLGQSIGEQAFAIGYAEAALSASLPRLPPRMR